MYVWAAFEAKSPPTLQDLVTIIPNNSLYLSLLTRFNMPRVHKFAKKTNIYGVNLSKTKDTV